MSLVTCTMYLSFKLGWAKIFFLKTKQNYQTSCYVHGSIFKKCKIKFVPTNITGGRISQHIGKGVDFNITNKLKCFQKHKCFI